MVLLVEFRFKLKLADEFGLLLDGRNTSVGLIIGVVRRFKACLGDEVSVIEL